MRLPTPATLADFDFDVDAAAGYQNRLCAAPMGNSEFTMAYGYGSVLVDDSANVVTISAAVARFLNISSGQAKAGDFAEAVAGLERRALDHSERAPVGDVLLADPLLDIDVIWRFAETPTHVRVLSHALRHGAHSGRVWAFDDVSALPDALAASEAAQTLLRASMDAMINPQVLFEAVRDPAGQVVDFIYRNANRAALAYLGLEEADLIGSSALATLPNLEGSGLLRRYAHCLDDGQPLIIDDFTYFNEILNDARRYDLRANRAGANLLSLTWSDVTERFNIAQRIAASEQNYRLLAENADDMVTHVRDGRFAWVSPSVDGVLGAPPAHWLGRELWEVVAPSDAPALAAGLTTLSEGGVVKQRVRVVSVDGLTHWVHLHAKPFYDAEGRKDGVTASLRLIDDEVAAQQAAEEARRRQAKADERYRRSMDNAAIGMCLIAPDGRFEEVNDALCRYFGYDAETLKKKTWQELTAPEYLEADVQRANDVLDGRIDSYRMVKQYLHADGHRIWGDLSVSCIRNRRRQVENFISQITDITALMEANERNRVLAQQLQQQAERLAAELDSAEVYLASIMPRGLAGEVSVSSRYLPSSELGGDCFDYTWIDEDHLLVYLIDVSGHGIAPALLSVTLHNLLRSGSFTPQTLLTPEAVLTELNRLFQMDQQGDHYFTMWYGVYEASARTLRYASAGAPPALAFTPATGGAVAVTELSSNSAPVGMFDDTVFTSGTYAVPPGCRILVYSDGAWELEFANDQRLSFADFTKLATRLARSPNWSLDALIDELRALTPTGAFEDDCSLILMTF